MLWNQELSVQAEGREAKEGMGVPDSCYDKELIHSLHQWIDLLRTALSRSEGWTGPLCQVLDVLRDLIGAPVAVVRAFGPGKAFSHVSAQNPILANQLSANGDFTRFCDHLFSTDQPLLVADALKDGEFADPFLRSEFPDLSLMTAVWPLADAMIQLAFFNSQSAAFTRDQKLLVDYFGCPHLLATYLGVDDRALRSAQGGDSYVW